MAELIGCDFETLYSKDYSLSKMTTEAYVRDPQFEVIGVSVKVGERRAEWFSGTKAQTRDFLHQFDWENAAAVAHNAAFDMLILNEHFDIRPRLILDTLSMARARVGLETSLSLDALTKHFKLGTKGNAVIAALGKRRADFTPQELAAYGVYCCDDTELAVALFEVLRKDFPKDEIRLIDLTIRMATEPVLRLDADMLRKHLNEVQIHKQVLLDGLMGRYGKDILMSNPKFADALRDFNVEPPMKVSPRTGKLTFAFAKTDDGLKDLIEHENPDVQALVAARLGLKSTLEETRTQGFLAVAARGALPVGLKYYGGHTGRWSAEGKLNLQNLPRKSPLKDAVVAPPGFTLVNSDLSQIEARVLAWLAGQDDLVDAFASGKDVYKLMACNIYGCLLRDVSKFQRQVGKAAVLGAGFGMGAARFQAQQRAATPSMDLPFEDCEQIIRTYRSVNDRIPVLWYRANNALAAIMNNQEMTIGPGGLVKVEGRNGIRLPNGMYLKYPNLRWEPYEDGEQPGYIYDNKRGRSKVRTRIYGASLVENIVQALARIIVGEQMLAVSKRYRVALTVHDALVPLVPTAEVEQGMEFIRGCMMKTPAWAEGLPVTCEIGSGDRYGDC